MKDVGYNVRGALAMIVYGNFSVQMNKRIRTQVLDQLFSYHIFVNRAYNAAATQIANEIRTT